MTDETVTRPRQRILFYSLLALVVVALGGATFASPYFVPGAIKQAALNDDREKLERLIDFPSVREGLKSDIKGYFAASMAKSMRDGEASPLAMGFATMLMGAVTNGIDTMLDGLVTPAGFSNAMRQGKAPTEGVAPALQPIIPHKLDSKSIAVEARYLDFGHFRYTANDTESKAQWVLDMRRRGLFDWQVTRLTAKFPPAE